MSCVFCIIRLYGLFKMAEMKKNVGRPKVRDVRGQKSHEMRFQDLYEKCTRDARPGDEINLYMRSYIEKYDENRPTNVNPKDKIWNKQFVNLDSASVQRESLANFVKFAMNAIVHVGMAREKNRRVMRAGHMVNGVRLVILDFAKELKIVDRVTLEGHAQVNYLFFEEVT